VALEPYLKILRRTIRSLRAFFAAHVIVVRTEADRELQRVVFGLAMLASAGMFFLASALLAAATAVALVQRLTGLPVLESMALSLGSTLLVALVLLGIAWLRLKKPLMPQSRELLKKTLEGLSRG